MRYFARKRNIAFRGRGISRLASGLAPDRLTDNARVLAESKQRLNDRQLAAKLAGRKRKQDARKKESKESEREIGELKQQFTEARRELAMLRDRNYPLPSCVGPASGTNRAANGEF